ncbi:MAG TPA: multidrug ABC transporter permease [Bacillus bacterium]|nr:multidrug ABC transporter permease [Bacillus sp. (in: firmicutes)]
MQSKVSSFKRGIVLQDLRSVGWIGIIYLIALLFAVPLQLVMLAENDQLLYQLIETRGLFTVLAGAQGFLIFTIPIILAVILSRYLHVKIAADFIHSLPIKRTALLNHHFLIGAFLLVVPVIITAVFIAIVHGILGFDDYFTMVEIAKWAGITILFNLFVFVMTMLIGMVTGISAVQVVLTYIFLIFPAGVMVLFNFNLKYFLYGFAYDYYFNRDIASLSPVLRFAEIWTWKFTITEILVYIVVTVVFYLLTMFAYKKRSIEAATQAIAFRSLRPIFKYGVTFCTMLVGGMYFGETQQQSIGWILFGYIFGSIFGYVIAEMVLEKTWRIFRRMKGYVVFAVAVVAIGFLLILDSTGYEKKMPAAAEIERAYFAEGIHWLKVGDDEAAYGEVMAKDGTFIESAINNENLFYFNNPDNINSILKLHQQLVMNKSNKKSDNPRYNKHLAIAYELKNGSKVVRQYQIPEKAYHEFLKPIYESEEFKYSNYELLRLKEGTTIDKISTSSRIKSSVFVDAKQIEEIIDALKLDMLEEPYEEMVNKRETWGHMEILLRNNERLYIPWKKSYTHFEAWLKKNNKLELVKLMPEDLSYATVIQVDDNFSEKAFNGMSGEFIENLFANNENSFKIEDPNQLEECLYEASWRLEGEYLLAIHYKTNGNPDFYGFVDVPPFIVEHFKK